MTKRLLAAVVVICLCAAGMPVPVTAAGQQPGEITGVVQDENQNGLPGYTVRLRNIDTGAIAGQTKTGSKGEFAFTGLAAGNYIGEAVKDGSVDGASGTLALTTAAMAMHDVVIVVKKRRPAAGFFTSTAGIVLLAGIGAGITAAIIAAQEEASPSR